MLLIQEHMVTFDLHISVYTIRSPITGLHLPLNVTQSIRHQQTEHQLCPSKK